MVPCGQGLFRSRVPEAPSGELCLIGLSRITLTPSPFQGQTIDDIPTSVLDDACQLVKANSIMGNKMNNIDIVYTMWDNLKKTAGMDVGQVAFHKGKDVRKMRVE